MVIVANRLPVQRVGGQWQTSPGGLVSALAPVLRTRVGEWIGWSGTAGRAPGSFEHERMRVCPVGLSAAEVDRFYHAFSNRTLWPLFHDAIRVPEFSRASWEAYADVNRKFARRALPAASRGDLIWVHDYQLLLVPGLIRELVPEARVGLFLHIPFPPEELFAWLPWREAILDGMLGADVVGFQTHASAQNFSRAARRLTSADGTDSVLVHHGRRVRVGAHPISIDMELYEALAQKPETRSRAAQLRERVGKDRTIFLAVDRLDYTKGIVERLCAFEDLLDRGELNADRCVLIQVAVPTREVVPEYAELRARIERTVGRINGNHSTPGRVAVHYFRRSLSAEELAAYYVAADVMLVTPLKDGMNLVSKEYLATRTDGSGVLVLSEFAGAAEQFRRALLVNPRDVDAMGTAMKRALRLSKRDARTRMAILRMMLRRHDVHEWAANFLGMLDA